MSKATFQAIAGRLATNPIFQSRGNRPQRPALEPAMKTGIGEGTVFLYCNRVTRALRELGLTCVGWPDEERKRVIKQAFEDRLGLYGVIGVVDGSLIEMTREPTVGAKAYYCRKNFPAVNMQAVVDHECLFIAFESGWPGSKNDKFIWLRSFPWIHRNQLFGEGEFLSTKGYPTTPFLLCPFANNEMGDDCARRRRFNRQLSKSRVLVECAFGLLKARFPALNTIYAMVIMTRSVVFLMSILKPYWIAMRGGGGTARLLTRTTYMMVLVNWVRRRYGRRA